MLVYLVTNKTNGKQYVGQTVYSVEHRWRQHIRWGTLVNPKSRFGYLHKAIHKYTPEQFDVEVIHTCESKEELDFVEIFYIALLKSKAPNGYNLTIGGEGTTGRQCSEETKDRIRNKAIGRTYSEEVNAKKGRRGRKQPPRPKEWCRKISEAAIKRMELWYGPDRLRWKGKRRLSSR